MSRKIPFEQYVLKFLNDYRGVPQQPEEIHRHLRSRVARHCEPEMNAAIDYLTAAGLVKQAARLADDPEVFTITAAGMRQAQRAVPADQLDTIVWPEG